MKLFKNILYSILSVQEKILRHQLSKTLGVKNSSKRKDRTNSRHCIYAQTGDIYKHKYNDNVRNSHQNTHCNRES